MLLLKNGKRAGENGTLESVDILIRDMVIVDIAREIDYPNAKTIDLGGKLVAPGFIDVHVHLREPGGEQKETIATGTRAAAKGGYTTIAAMPNTNPVTDSAETLAALNAKIKQDSVVRVLPYAAITAGEQGEELVDMKTLAQSSILGFSDDGRGVQSAGLMYQAMLAAKRAGKPIVAHAEEDSLLFGGYLHAGVFAQTHGHPGIPSVSESAQIARDIMLAGTTGAQYHVCHISTKESVALVRFAKQMGYSVTAEVAPHHLLLSDTDIDPADIANYKMNPPLRSSEDREACVAGLLDGTIDIIASDHAPHTADEKAVDVAVAPFGIVGLETAFSLLYTHLVKNGKLSLAQLIDCMSTKVAKIFSLPYGRLEAGKTADITVIDLEQEMTIDREAFRSKGKNTPFHGQTVWGVPTMTIVEGEIVYV